MICPIDSTLEILTGLSEANKLVGVISHREELNAIPQKIIVNKAEDKTGSFIRIDMGV